MFKKALARLPIAISGLALGNMALSNLFYHLNLSLCGLICFTISWVILILVCMKWVVKPQMFIKELKNVNTFAILPTIPMTLMLMLFIMKNDFLIKSQLVAILWYVAILLHIIFIIIFVGFYAFRNYKARPNTSWFVMFVGIGVIGETSSAFNIEVGSIATTLGSLLLIAILIYVLITKAWQTYNQEQFPMIIIISAPAALCLNGYLVNHSSYAMTYVIILFILSQLLFIFSLVFFPTIIQRGFKVSFSALTFPWVTTAASLYNITQKVSFNQLLEYLFNILSVIEIVWAIIVVIYVNYKYFTFLINKNESR
jgi:exfoliative toxin A/B